MGSVGKLAERLRAVSEGLCTKRKKKKKKLHCKAISLGSRGRDQCVCVVQCGTPKIHSQVSNFGKFWSRLPLPD